MLCLRMAVEISRKEMSGTTVEASIELQRERIGRTRGTYCLSSGGNFVSAVAMINESGVSIRMAGSSHWPHYDMAEKTAGEILVASKCWSRTWATATSCARA